MRGWPAKSTKFTYPFAQGRGSGTPTIDVAIDVDIRTAIVQKQQASQRFNLILSALLDTGAHRTFIDEDTVKALNLRPITRHVVRSPLMPDGQRVWIFPIAVRILGKKPNQGFREVASVESIPAALIPTPTPVLVAQGAPRVIIGRDVLSLLRFDYFGEEQRVDLYLKSKVRRNGLQLRRM